MNIFMDGAYLEGSVSLPASKSYLHRALIAASLADSVSVISNFTLAEDVLDTIRCLTSLGTKISITDVITVTPRKYKNKSIRIKESGTTYRLLIPILGALFNQFSIQVDEGLKSRPLTGYESLGMKRMDEDHLFNLPTGRIELDGSVSSQFVSGMLFALPLMTEDSELIVLDKRSENYILMTIEVIKSFGIEIEVKGNSYLIKGNQKYTACDYEVEPDFSALAFMAVAGIIHGDVFINAPRSSTQPDFKIIEILRQFSSFTYNAGYVFKKSQVLAFDCDVDQCPDLAPALAVLAMYADGPCTIRGIERLVYKESNRIEGILKLREFGAIIEVDEVIKITPSNYHQAKIDQRDHRIAMMALIIPECKTVINAESIDKSYPNFIKDMKCLGRLVEVT